jgi:hypothetical protein
MLDPRELGPGATPKIPGSGVRTHFFSVRPYRWTHQPWVLRRPKRGGYVRRTHYIWVLKMDPLHVGLDDGHVDLADNQIQGNIDLTAAKSRVRLYLASG